MSNVVKFEAHGKRYDMSIIDRDGHKWITSQQLGEALGVKNIRSLIRDLQSDGELKDGKHCCRVTRQQPGDRQRRQILVLSYRGVARVAMRAQSSRARLFRDWMEDVLIEVMLTGSYQVPSATRHLSIVRRDAMLQGIALADILSSYPRPVMAKIVHFRRIGLSQKEAAGALDMPIRTLKTIEEHLHTCGIYFDPVNANKRNKQIVDNMMDNLVMGISQ